MRHLPGQAFTRTVLSLSEAMDGKQSPYDAIRQRWSTERPFAGHTMESLQRKLVSGCLRAEIKALVQAELELRGSTEIK